MEEESKDSQSSSGADGTRDLLNRTWREAALGLQNTSQASMAMLGIYHMKTDGDIDGDVLPFGLLLMVSTTRDDYSLHNHQKSQTLEIRFQKPNNTKSPVTLKGGKSERKSTMGP